MLAVLLDFLQTENNMNHFSVHSCNIFSETCVIIQNNLIQISSKYFEVFVDTNTIGIPVITINYTV